MAYLWRTPLIRSSLLATATINFFNFMFWALFFLYATRTLDVGPGLLGLVLGAASVGGLKMVSITSTLRTRYASKVSPIAAESSGVRG